MYATIQQLKDRLHRDYDEFYRDPDTGAADDTLAGDDLTAASADVDSYLATRYVTPVTDSDALPLLRHWTLTLCEELAFLRAGGSSAPEKVENRVKAVRKQMERIAGGKGRLPGSPTENETGTGGAAYVSAAEPVFTRDQMKGW